MTTPQRVRWTLGLAVVFLLIVATGRSNVHNSKKIQAALETVYQDRLLVKGLIFDLRTLVHDKELALVRGDEAYFAERSGAANTLGLGYLERFRGTYLVPREEATLDRFAATWAEVMATEAATRDASGVVEGEAAERLAAQLERLKTDLRTLSKIQLDEGRRQAALGDKAVESMDLFATVETYLLAALGALAIVVVLLIPKRARA